MALITAATVTYVITSLLASKGGQKAKEEVSEAIWQWIRPILLTDDEKFVDALEQKPESETLKQELELKLKRKVELEPDFAALLEAQLAKAEARGEYKPKSGNTYIQNYKGDKGKNIMKF